MAQHDVASDGRAGEQPRKSGVHRIAPSVCQELVALRELAQLVGSAFEYEGDCHRGSTELLQEALRCARSDIEMLGAVAGVPDGMAFTRAQYRIDLALALAKYIEKFGQPAERMAREAHQAEYANAEGGAS